MEGRKASEFWRLAVADLTSRRMIIDEANARLRRLVKAFDLESVEPCTQ